jgi:hypothetical protein
MDAKFIYQTVGVALTYRYNFIADEKIEQCRRNFDSDMARSDADQVG